MKYPPRPAAHVLGSSETSQTPPTAYPEQVPQTGPQAGNYALRDKDSWTCGFFPGSIYSLIERLVKFPLAIAGGKEHKKLIAQLHALGRAWSDPLFEAAKRTDTHDMGFMIQPAMRVRWEVLHESDALDAILTAARALYTRNNTTVGAIRSWDAMVQHGIDISDMASNFLVIIDSLCNLDLLYYAAAHTGETHLAEAATTHAKTLLRTHLRKEADPSVDRLMYSTVHVVNFDPATGEMKERLTAQGYSASSTWSRGQAWAILGYAQTYNWTKDPDFLDAACGLSEYFWLRLQKAPDCVEVKVPGESRTRGRHVPLWDFDAPVDPAAPLRDSSAGTIAANGMLILAQTLLASGAPELSSRYLNMAVLIIKDTLDLCGAARSRLVTADDGSIATEDSERDGHFDSILKHATANNNERSLRRAADHGLVYGDYYLIEFANRLLKMGLV